MTSSWTRRSLSLSLVFSFVFLHTFSSSFIVHRAQPTTTTIIIIIKNCEEIKNFASFDDILIKMVEHTKYDGVWRMYYMNTMYSSHVRKWQARDKDWNRVAVQLCSASERFIESTIREMFTTFACEAVSGIGYCLMIILKVTYNFRDIHDNWPIGHQLQI